MKKSLRLGLVCLMFGAMSSMSAPEAEAGLFAKLFGKKSACCEPEPVCCEPEPEPCCASYSMPELAEGEVLISISPLLMQSTSHIAMAAPVRAESIVSRPLPSAPGQTIAVMLTARLSR